MPRFANTLRWSPVCLLLTLASLCSLSAAAAASAAPLTPSDYTVRPACAAPSPGRAACLVLGLAPKTTVARARTHSFAIGSAAPTSLVKPTECAEDYPATCLTPQDLRNAYFPGEAADAPTSEPQTVALVDAYNDPNAVENLATYEKEFDVECTGPDCFEQVNQNGETTNLPFPKSKLELETFAVGTHREREEAEEAEGWSLEIATDIEMTRAICQNCHIVLVEASSPEYSNLEIAENTAAKKLHATEISNSWGGQEPETDSEAFNHPDIPITGAAGDYGYLNWDEYANRNEQGSPYFEGASYPAASPHVISVGGTSLSLTPEGAWESESAWNLGGGGCSGSFPTPQWHAPEWQLHVSDWAAVGCGQYRASTDVSADANTSTGVNVYDTTPYPEEEKGKRIRVVPNWIPVGGTSVASPIIASMFALAGGAHGVAYPARTLYSHLGSSLLHDVTSGGNGKCDDDYTPTCSGSLTSPLDCGAGSWICNATTGYDGPTGVGTPNGIGAFKIGEEGEPTSKPIEESGTSKDGSGEGPGGGSGGSSETPSTTGSNESNNSGGGSPSGAQTQDKSPGKSEHSHTAAKQRTRISALTLTANARAALRHRTPAIAQLAFSCTVSRVAAVHVTLSLQVHSAGHAHWRTLPGSLAFKAVKGLNRRRLHGLGNLAPGIYRLTLTPAGGTARSITFRVP